MIHRMSKTENFVRHSQAKTSQEKLWFETPLKDSQRCWRGKARRQTVPYVRSRDQKWV